MYYVVAIYFLTHVRSFGPHRDSFSNSLSSTLASARVKKDYCNNIRCTAENTRTWNKYLANYETIWTYIILKVIQLKITTSTTLMYYVFAESITTWFIQTYIKSFASEHFARINKYLFIMSIKKYILWLTVRFISLHSKKNSFDSKKQITFFK